MLPVKLRLWGRRTAWQQWLFTISIWDRARQKPIRGNVANSSWQNDPDGSLPAEFILTTTQKSGWFFPPPANSVISGAKWDDIVCVAVWINLAEDKTASGQIFISCFWFSSMERLTASSRQTRNQDIAETQPRAWVPTSPLNLNKISRENCCARLQKCTLANAVRS